MPTTEERLTRIEAIMDEGLPQRARMIAQLDRMEARQIDQATVGVRVTNLEDDRDAHELRLNSHEAVIRNPENYKNRAIGIVVGVGTVSSIVSTLLTTQISKAVEKFMKVFS